MVPWYQYTIRYHVRWVPRGTHLSSSFSTFPFSFLFSFQPSWPFAFVALAFVAFAFVAQPSWHSQAFVAFSAFVAFLLLFALRGAKISILHPATSTTLYVSAATHNESRPAASAASLCCSDSTTRGAVSTSTC